MKTTFVCGLLAIGAIATASAEEFPLTFRTIPAAEVVAFPGSYGAMAQLRQAKPAKLRREPKPASNHALYGDGREGSSGAQFLVRLDESRGEGQGYDQLIVDMNQNGDLTDDSPAPLVVLLTDRKTTSRTDREKMFGPITAPPAKTIAGGRPVYYAQVYLNVIRSYFGTGRTQSIPVGYLRLKAGWYVDTTVELKGVKRKVGVFDGDGNLRLGDMAKPQTYRSSGREESWYFRGGDSLLVDADGSGAFDRDALESESCPYASVVYLGAAPYKLALTRGGNTLQVEPWADRLAEVTLEPRGEQVRSVTLAWERTRDQWQLIRAGVAGGKISVPAGAWRLYKCELLGDGAARNRVMAAAYQRVPKTPLGFAPGRANTLRCGAPLEIIVTTRKKTVQARDASSGGFWSLLRPTATDAVLAINANVRGAGGEVYSAYAKGESLDAKPPKPVFTLTDGSGKKVATGNLEFG